MASNYAPDDRQTHAFARFKRHYEAQKLLMPEIKEMAAEALKGGATVGELAKWTGLTDEVFRRIARAEGVELLRPPTNIRDQPPVSE